jgi:hypothetical protein
MRDGLRLIEWPERAPSLEATADAVLTLRYSGAGRDALLTVLTPRAAEAFSGTD